MFKNGNFTLLLTSSDQIWQMNLLQPMDSPYKSKDALNTSTQNLADEPMLADGTPGTRADMPCIPLHTTWQMNIHWPVNPPPNITEQRSLHTATDI